MDDNPSTTTRATITATAPPSPPPTPDPRDQRIRDLETEVAELKGHLQATRRDLLTVSAELDEIVNPKTFKRGAFLKQRPPRSDSDSPTKS